MKVEYKYRKNVERKTKLIPIIHRKYERMAKHVLAKGGSMKSGRWEERKMNVSGKVIHDM